MGKKFIKHLVLVLSSVVVGLMLVEVCVRLYLAFVPAPDNSPYIPDPHAVYRIRPTPPGTFSEGQIFINSFGFRDRNHTIEKPEGSYRILGIGDSFVWGAVPLEENFLCLTKTYLRTELTNESADVDMVLMGLGGYSPENYVGILRSMGLSLDPDLVILNLFVGNDIHMIQVRGELFRGRRYFVGSPNHVLNVLRKSRAFVISEMYFLTRIKSIILGRRYRQAFELIKAQPRSNQAAEAPRGSEPYVISKMYIHIQDKRLRLFRREPTRRIEKLWQQTEAYLLDFDRLCKDSGVPWILHIIPTEVQVDIRTRQRILAMLNLTDDEYDFNLPQNRLREFAGIHGIMVLDPLPELRLFHRENNRLYLPNNTHWNTRGNALAGHILGDFVKENVLSE